MNSHMLNSFRCSGRGMAELPRTVVLLLDPVLEPMVPLPHVLGGVGSLMAPVGGLEPAGGELLFVWQLRQSTLLPRGWLAVLRVRTSRHIVPQTDARECQSIRPILWTVCGNGHRHCH